MADATEAIRLEPSWPKLFARKGKALFGLQEYRKAANCFSKGNEKWRQKFDAEASKHARELDALKKQAQGSQDQCFKLCEENEKLRRKLSDFNAAFGDVGKKQA